MQTIQVQEIDGYKIITKINTTLGMEDPEATRKIVEVEIQKTDIFKKIVALKNQMGTYIQQATLAARSAKTAKKSGQPWQAFWNEFLTRTAQAKACEDELKLLAIEFKQKYCELMVKHAVYFNLSAGEEYIEDAEADEIEALMIQAYAEGAVLDRDKKKVPDNRGRLFWAKTDKWNRTEIRKLGDVAPVGGIEEKNLSTAQITEITNQMEIERIASLKAADKAEEKIQVISALQQRAGAMNSELSVQGNKSALATAQMWLSEEMKKVELRYA